MLVDSHCHLDFPDFAGDLEEVLERARQAGVHRFLTICTHLSRFEQVHNLAKRFKDVWCTVGVHPHEVEHETSLSLGALLQASQDPKVVGFGETGLDFFYEHSPREIQEHAFRIHIQAAQQTGLPIIIHTRQADERMIEILKEESQNAAFKGLIHCFSSAKEIAEVALELGFYLSFSGIITFKSAQDLREIVKIVPSDRILVETDAPYLAPIPMRGKRNEPSFTRYTAEFIARDRGVKFEEIAEISTQNFLNLFEKVR